MSEKYKNSDDQDIVIPTPKDTTIIAVSEVDYDNPEGIARLIEKALLQRKCPLLSRGESLALHLVSQGNPPIGY